MPGQEIIDTIDTLAIAPVDTIVVRHAVVDTVPGSVADTVPDWLSGLSPEALPDIPSSRGGVIMVVALLIILVLFNFNGLCRMTRFYVDELFKVHRGRDNVFDERPASVVVIQLLLISILVVCGGYLAAAGISVGVFHDIGLITTRRLLLSMLTLTGYYIFQREAYSLVGYVFADDENRREWKRGFSSSYNILAMIIAIPAMIALFYPGTMLGMSILAAILFIVSKIVFIFKGFRIFYDNLFSLLYFILYLCTLEIIPIIVVYKLLVMIV